MPNFNTLEDIGDLTEKVALVRVDFNVPTIAGQVSDNSRLRAAIQTVEILRKKGGKVALLSHFGRPNGVRSKDLSLEKVASAFSKLIDPKVEFASDCIGQIARTTIDRAPDQGVVLLENTRFYEGEETNDSQFAEELAKLGDIFVNDAFSVAHRVAASNHAITKFLPSYAGKSMTRELEALDIAISSPKRPVFAIVGGSKVSTKIDLLNNLVTKVDTLAVGGGMANTFLYAQGYNLGNSLVEKSLQKTALEIINKASRLECELLLPFDVTVAEDLKRGIPHHDTSIENIGNTEMALDVGLVTLESWIRRLNQSKTVIWNGPVGAFETVPFGRSTKKLAMHVATLASSGKLTAVAGGGDTIAALNMAEVTEDFTHVSTAGGAFLQWLEGKPLPGVVALTVSASI